VINGYLGVSLRWEVISIRKKDHTGEMRDMATWMKVGPNVTRFLVAA
jgi:hypothetical protein